MNGFNMWMERYFVPVAAKIGSQKHLVIIRDAFIGIMPITMAGSIAVLLNVFLRDLPTKAGMTDFVTAMQPIIGVNGNVWWGTTAMIALSLVFSIGYNVAKAYDVNALAGGLVSFSALMAATPQVASFEATIAETTSSVTGWGFVSVAYTDAKGLFTALIIGLVSGMIYAIMMKKKIIIKLPDSVPPAVSTAFAAIIPGVVAIYVSAIAAYIVGVVTGGLAIGDLILKYLQMPLLGFSQGFGSVILATVLVQLFWFFGLHGTNVLAPILDGVYKTALNANISQYQLSGTTEGLEYLWTRGSFDAFAWMGGAGCTLALIISVIIFSKREDQRAVAKVAAPMGVFNINEPVVFGLPLVLNPIYIIPFIAIPTILVSIGYAATVLGFVPPVFVDVPWVIPPVIFAYLATGGSLAAAALSAVNLALGVVMWTPFVIAANKVKISDIEE